MATYQRGIMCFWCAIIYLLIFTDLGRHDNIRVLQTSASSHLSLHNSTGTTTIPWLSKYIAWHQQIRSDPVKFNKANILIVNEGYGGLGDRLKHIPYYMWLASKHDRILLIHWSNKTSCGIDEFFQPNFLNWTLPSDMIGKSKLLNTWNDWKEYFSDLMDDKVMEEHSTDRIVEAYGNHQSLIRGLSLVFQASNSDKRVFKDIFQSLFKLSDPVQQLLDQTKKDIGLGDDYIGVHLRLRYPGVSPVFESAGGNGTVDVDGIAVVTPQVKHEIQRLSNHAIQCTRKASGRVNGKVYFASDTVLAMELQHQHDPQIVHLKTDTERVHFAKRGKECQSLYPAIVDLWLLSDAKCIGFGAGGYGALATMMSEFDCYTMHQSNRLLTQGIENDNFFKDENNTFPECLL